MTIDHLRTAIAEQVPSLQSWEVDGLAKKLEGLGLIDQAWVGVKAPPKSRGPFEAIDSKGRVGLVTYEDGDGWDGWTIDLDDIVAIRPRSQLPKE